MNSRTIHDSNDNTAASFTACERVEHQYPTGGAWSNGLDTELHRYSMHGTDVIVHTVGDGSDVYTPVGVTDSVDKAVAHTGPVIKDASFERIEMDDDDIGGTVPVGYHPIAGRYDVYEPGTTFDHPVVLLDNLQHAPITQQ